MWQLMEGGCSLFFSCHPNQWGNDFLWLRVDCISVVYADSGRFLAVTLHFLTDKQTTRNSSSTYCAHTYFSTDCVFINRGEAGGDERRSEAIHNWARGRVWRAGSPLQLHPHMLCLRYQSTVLASWLYICMWMSLSPQKKHWCSFTVINFDWLLGI